MNDDFIQKLAPQDNPEEQDLGSVFADEPSASYKTLAFVWEILKIILIALAIILPVRYLIVQPFYVNGNSMESNFQNGNYVMIDEFSYRFLETPQRGDVVVFRFPFDTKEFYIKRVVGLPGETVEIRNNQVIIYNDQNPNGFVLDESVYLDPGTRTSSRAALPLEDQQYFVLGDNRENSSDSRFWGAVNKSHISGRVFFRAWPLNKIDTFDTPIYTIN